MFGSSLDIGIGDTWIEPFEILEAENHLEFAGFPATKLPAISREQQFAEKIHIYTLPRKPGVTNSRVKDIVDLVLLINSGTMKTGLLAKAIQSTFKRRDTHKWSQDLQPPPNDWQGRFTSLAQECKLDPNIDQAFEIVQKFVRSLVF